MKKESGSSRISVRLLFRLFLSVCSAFCMSLVFPGCETSSPGVSSPGQNSSLADDLGTDEIHLQRARVLMEEEKWQESVELISPIVERNRGITEGLISTGVMEVAGRGNKAAAQDYLAQSVITGVIMADSLVLRGKAYLSLGQYEKAIADFKEFIELSPDYPLGYFYCGIACMMMRDLEKATEYMLTTRRLNPNMAAVHTNLGFINMELENYEEAVENFNAALMITGHLANALAGRARAKWAIGKKRSAVRDLTLALSMGNEAEHQSYRGWYRACLGDIEAGLEDMNASLERAEGGERMYALYRRGWLQYGLGNLDSAAQDFSESIENQPEDNRDDPYYSNLLLAITHFRLNDPGKAGEILTGYQEFFAGQSIRDEEERIWFSSLMDYFLDRKSQSELFVEVDNADPDYRDRFFLEGTFYVAQKFLINGDVDSAMTYLEEVRKIGETRDFEFQVARWQLKYLKASD